MSTSANDEAPRIHERERGSGAQSRTGRLRLLASAAAHQASTPVNRRSAGARQACNRLARRTLCQSLVAHQDELQALVLERVRAVGAPPGSEDERYAATTPVVVAAAVERFLESVASPGCATASLPAVMALQVRRAARRGIGATTLVRRVFAGHEAIDGVLVEHALALGISAKTGGLKAIREDLGALFELLVAGVTEEHASECARMPLPPVDHRRALVERALRGDDRAAAELPYELHERTHVSIIAHGEGASRTLGEIARALHLGLLAVRAADGGLWAWLGTSGRAPAEEIERLLGAAAACGETFALGAPGAGLEGWRRTHAQAQGALRLAQFVPRSVTSYAANPLLACALADDPLRAWLEDLVGVLGARTQHGSGLQECLCAYIDAGFNAQSAAASLGIGRRTVERRVKDAETVIGRPLYSCAAELRLALELQALGA